MVHTGINFLLLLNYKLEHDLGLNGRFCDDNDFTLTTDPDEADIVGFSVRRWLSPSFPKTLHLAALYSLLIEKTNRRFRISRSVGFYKNVFQ